MINIINNPLNRRKNVLLIYSKRKSVDLVLKIEFLAEKSWGSRGGGGGQVTDMYFFVLKGE